MLIRPTLKSDFLPINTLLASYGHAPARLEAINNKDIGLVAISSEGEVVGHIWVGLMARNTFGYIDNFVVDRRYSGQGVGQALAQKALDLAKRRGVREAFGVIMRGEHHNKSALNALKMAMGAHPESYTYVCGQIDHMLKELELYGR